MTVQQQAARMTREALDSLLRTAQFVPEDKLDWCPMGAARTVRDQLAECVQMGYGLPHLIHHGSLPEGMGREKFQEYRKTILEECRTIEDFAKRAREGYEGVYQAIETVPDENLEKVFELPFLRGLKRTGADMLFLAYWNLTYHIGQINYVQMMLGDTAMH